jgi:hypothetical protein
MGRKIKPMNALRRGWMARLVGVAEETVQPAQVGLWLRAGTRL